MDYIHVSAENFDAVSEYYDTYGEVRHPYEHPFGMHPNLSRCIGWMLDFTIVETATDASGELYRTGRVKLCWSNDWISVAEMNALRDDAMLSDDDTKGMMRAFITSAARPRPAIVTGTLDIPELCSRPVGKNFYTKRDPGRFDA